MKKSVTVRVPATSANCGPGFDSLGLALTLYNDFTFTISDEIFGFSLEVEGEGKDSFHASGRNMAFASFLAVWNKITDHKRIGIDVHMHNQVPKSRGLGSSSTAIVAGVTAASILSGANLTLDEILQEANAMEGHPDNVAPAIYGGFTISFQENGVAHTLRTIPKEIPHPDAVFNSSRTALLTAALLENRPELLQYALEDKLHQPYRAKLIPGLAEVFAAGEVAGAYKCIISGSGSTLLAYASPDKDGETIGKAMVDAFAQCGQSAVYHILQLNTKGMEILHMEL